MYLYRDANTFFHSFHPLTKFFLLLIMIALPFFALSLPAIALVFLGYICLLFVAKGAPNLAKFWKMLIIFWVFTFTIWIIIPRLRGWQGGYENAAVLATRIDTFVLSGLLFVTITRIEEFTFALTRMGIPYKAAFALSLGFRLVPLFYQNLQTIVSAQKSRGVDLESGGIFSKAGKYGPIIAVLISYSLRNADLMAMSLEAKGFGYSSRRTSFLNPQFSWRDASFVVGAVLILVAMIFFGRSAS